MEKVSIIIPTFNRFLYLLNTIASIKDQTYPDIEIIVVNDKSTQEEYYTHDWNKEGVIMIHLPENTKTTFGYVCAGHVRNTGIEKATGHYIAFCDDDDIWFPSKLHLQIDAMKETGCRMSSTDGLLGHGVYNPRKRYMKYNSENCYPMLKEKYNKYGSDALDNGFPKIWTMEFLKIHNCVICSSVVMEKTLLDDIGNMKCVNNGNEDYDCWLRALGHTNLVYVDDICFYYDNNHGNGQNY